MKNYSVLKRIKELYDSGENIIKFLKDLEKRNDNSIEDILISYDFQAGSYISITNENLPFRIQYTEALANVIKNLGQVNTILEVGVGEATTLGNLIRKLPGEINFGGFDISWSRIYYGRKYLNSLNVNAFLCTADLFNSPFADSSIDVVYTSHSLEPNGGQEKEALQELYRITNKYLVLLEPSYELADEAARKRMISNGYIINLMETIRQIGYDLIEYRKFDYSSNPLNPTALYIIRKDAYAKLSNQIRPVCPILKTPLEERADHLFSHESLLSYPKIKSIPCLVPSNAVLTSKMDYE